MADIIPVLIEEVEFQKYLIASHLASPHRDLHLLFNSSRQQALLIHLSYTRFKFHRKTFASLDTSCINPH